MKSLRWVVAAVAALVMGWSTVASAPVAAAADGDYVSYDVGCGYVDVQNVGGVKVKIMYGDPNRKKPDGVFSLAAGKDKRITTKRKEFVFLVLSSNGKYLLQVSDEVSPQNCPTVASATPTITGTAQVGQQLTADTTGWGPSDITLTYQWYRSGKKIKGATASTYTPTKSDKGKKLTVKVTGALSGYFGATKTSKATAKVKAGVLTTAEPAISGSAVVGATLHGASGAWGPAGVKLSYQWYRGASKIKGATKPDYKVAKKDKDKQLVLKVTGKLSGYTTKTVASAPTAKVVVAPL